MEMHITLTSTSITFPYSTLGTYLGTSELFVFLYRLCLFDTKILPSIDVFQILAIDEFDFRIMIHAHVPSYFLNGTIPLPVVINLNTKFFYCKCISCAPFR